MIQWNVLPLIFILSVPDGEDFSVRERPVHRCIVVTISYYWRFEDVVLPCWR